MTSMIISLLVGFGLPALVALVTKDVHTELFKQVILALLAAATGVLTGLVGAAPHGWTQWEHVLVAIGVAFIAAVQSKYGLAEVHAVLAKKTANSGL